MHAFDGLKRSLPRPSSEGTGAVRVELACYMLSAHQRVQVPLHAPQRPREHHEPRRGSAFRAAPRLVHCQIPAVAAIPCTRAAFTSSMSIDDDALPCQGSPEHHSERGMASDESECIGVAGEGG